MKKFFIVLVLSVTVLSGCVIKFSGNQPPAVAGMFKSFDAGETWVAKNLFQYSGGLGNIAGVNVLNLNFDPQDNRAIYFASDTAGLFYSYDSGDSWRKADMIGNGRIESVAVDPHNKCVIYASFANTVLKTVDCNRTWSEVYIDTRKDKNITAIAVDPGDNNTIYAGNTAGDILKSLDGGATWRVIDRVGNQVSKILISPADNKIIYLATKNKGIFKTITGGADWFEVNEGLKQYSGALEYRNLIFDLATPNSLLLVAKYGLIRTTDGGQTWQAISLLTPPASTEIYATAISPKNSQEIYYATATTFYKSTDGGKNWITSRLPSAAAASFLLIDPLNNSMLYLGMANVTKK